MDADCSDFDVCLSHTQPAAKALALYGWLAEEGKQLNIGSYHDHTMSLHAKYFIQYQHSPATTDSPFGRSSGLHTPTQLSLGLNVEALPS